MPSSTARSASTTATGSDVAAQCALDLLLGENYASGVTPGFLDEMGEDKVSEGGREGGREEVRGGILSGGQDSSILAVCYHNMAVELEHLQQACRWGGSGGSREGGSREQGAGSRA
eukprot:693241-Hanusia_phi.AAC.2